MERENLVCQLSGVSIPAFTYPWPEACSPDVEAAEAQMIKWGESHGLFVNDAYRERVSRTRYAWLAARCYPKADPDLLQAIADYFLWFFIIDDLFVDRVETVTQDTLRNLTAMIDVLDYVKVGKKPVYGELAWLNVSLRLRNLLGAEPFERFAQGMRLWATTAGLQILNHTRSNSVGIPQYETIRRHTSGMNPCLALSDAANGGSVDSNYYYRSDIQQLCQLANIVCWSNDIQSLAVELRQPGQYWNMVVIRAFEGYTLQESIDYTAARVNTEISQFLVLSDEITARDGPNIAGLVDGMKYWIRGYQDWVEKDTLRYATQFASMDADDRGLLSISQ
ncbi:Sesquiterpene synthase [Cladobotryum mycophilum]|uniref:Terpene synthase n=1 Tax=Cladobotryum mycophilum TaxID=491253 RepID=A0ABR0SVP6_9HYPO